MYFVGRAKAINKIHRALEQGNNIIVQVKFGIGRTSLVRHLAAINQDRWHFWFADFSLTPEKLCRQLFNELFPDEKRGHRLKYKSLRQRIVTASKTANEKVILVLDNITTITSARIELLRYLFDQGNFCFIAIADNSLARQERLQLRAILHLTYQIFLNYLRSPEIEQYFQHYSSKYQWNWSEDVITSTSRLTRGYPLFMTESLAELEKFLCKIQIKNTLPMI